ncbi:MAG: SpoIIE family protein phosphatase, partial [Clostridia bacterium]|nr:SpoIIE family protein phosphatase [Clostridia bacterium]
SATADLLEADLINGRLAFYKCAAPPSYIKGAGGVRKAAGGGLYGGQTRVTYDEAEDGEVILMVTDGVEDGLSDGEFVRTVSEAPGEDPQALCEALLKKIMKKNGAQDDGSVAALRLKKAE